MAIATLSTPAACAEVACPAPRPTSIERRFAQLTRRLRALSGEIAALDGAPYGSEAFHFSLRAVELAEERIASDLRAIIHAPGVTLSDFHLRQLCWKLHLALSIEDGEDADWTVDRIHAVPDLLYLPMSCPGAARVNDLVGSCLQAFGELQSRDVPALQLLRGEMPPTAAAPDLADYAAA